MKTKIILFIIVLSIIIFALNKQLFSKNKALMNINFPELNSKIHIKKLLKQNQNNIDFLNAKRHCLITCDGTEYDSFPNLNEISNLEFVKLIEKYHLPDPSGDNLWGDKELITKEVQNFIFSKHHFKDTLSLISSDCIFRIDKQRLEWAIHSQLPTNGNFIMLILACWEKDLTEPPSTGYYLCTFDLKGKMQSMVYSHGTEEFDDYNTPDSLSMVWGRAYCLKTDKPIIRIVKNWDFYVNRGGYKGTTIEVKELTYNIDVNGFINLASIKTIFPKKHVQWKDRDFITFEEESDTIRKMLGEIE